MENNTDNSNNYSHKSNVNNEVEPCSKRRKINNNTARRRNSKVNEPQSSCDMCHQPLQNLKAYKNDLPNAVFEDVALTDEKLHLSIDGEVIEEELNLTYKLVNFSVYDEHRHLCRLDTGLIENNVYLYCSGYIVPIFDEDPSSQSGVPTKNIGPINEWYTTGFDGGKNVLVCISTAFAEYYLVSPSEQYQSFMHPVYEKAYTSKLVIEFLTTKDEPTYEDLIDELQRADPPIGMSHLTEESLLHNVQFICDQVTYLDIDSSDSENSFPLLTTPCMRSLVKLTGVTVGKTLKPCNSHSKSPIKPKNFWTTPATTKLVKEIFEKFFPKNQNSNDKTRAKQSGSCGVCEACQKSDCGACPTCKKRKKSKSAQANSLVCIKRRCPNKAIQDADSDSSADDCDTRDLEINSYFPRSTSRLAKITEKSIKLLGRPLCKIDSRTYYETVQVDSLIISLGDNVIVDVGNSNSEQLAKVIYMWKEDERVQVHLNWFIKGTETILGNIADENEVFVVDECVNVPLTCIKRQCTLIQHQMPENWSPLGNTNLSLDKEAKDFLKDHYFCHKRYVKHCARFVDVLDEIRNPGDSKSLPYCSACTRVAAAKSIILPQVLERDEKTEDDQVLYHLALYRNDEYRIGDGVYILPSTVFMNKKKIIPPSNKPNLEDIDEIMYPEYYRKYFTGDHIKGSNYDTPDPFDIGYIASIYVKTSSEEIKPEDIRIKINRMYRCEDIDEELLLAGKIDSNKLYWSTEIYDLPLKNIMGKCYITFSCVPAKSVDLCHQFYFNQVYDSTNKVLSEPPASLKSAGCHIIHFENSEKKPLKTLDIFAGCGGLSAGLSKAGVAEVLWAIEKDSAAARAFEANHSKAVIFNDDCNSILDNIIHEKNSKFPRKGEVELLCGGPPCQGFSGLNRFNSTQYSYLKNTLLFTFLSYCDYYRPKFVVMENVHNFTLHSKGLMLKIALYCLLKIGYQCTFAIVQAGNFGLPQSRRRTILLAAAPGQTLPNYPEPLHVFSKRASQLDVVIDGKKYVSNCFWRDSAPYPTVNVHDAISDLPIIDNGANTQQIVYGTEAKSNFQRKMRNCASNNKCVDDHVCKKMSPLVEARIMHIPKTAGADWRDLPNIVVKLNDGTFTKKLEYRYEDKKGGKNNSGKLRGVCPCASGQPCNPLDRQENTLIPWCLPHTGNRQYGWAGTYGRLDWYGFFGTTITNPEPLGKQGRVLHPEQSRVVSVRECARSQGFPDNYCFKGSVIEKYRQIGNAVPPPLAEAIGYEIKKIM